MPRNDTKFNHSELHEYVDRSIKKECDQLQDMILKIVGQMIIDRTGDLLTADETASLLSVSKRTLSNWATEGVLPKYRLGGKLYWKFDEIIDYMERDCANEPDLDFS